ncbi:MAG: hypothetical protein ACRDXX_00705 [Stackebrandtia sp.]
MEFFDLITSAFPIAAAASALVTLLISFRLRRRIARDLAEEQRHLLLLFEQSRKPPKSDLESIRDDLEEIQVQIAAAHEGVSNLESVRERVHAFKSTMEDGLREAEQLRNEADAVRAIADMTRERAEEIGRFLGMRTAAENQTMLDELAKHHSEQMRLMRREGKRMSTIWGIIGLLGGLVLAIGWDLLKASMGV